MKDYRKEFNKEILEATYKAQRKYGFEISTGDHATWNNESDAFKHAYMQAWLSIKATQSIAHILGDYHELETPYAPIGERNMDLWNNAIGREVVDDMKQEYGKEWQYIPENMKLDEAAKRIVLKMRQGELITSPSDKRKIENMKFERLKPENKVFYKGELSSSDSWTDAEIKQFVEQTYDGQPLPSKLELDVKTKTGELIYVDNYTKADGTKVHGYYRRKGK